MSLNILENRNCKKYTLEPGVRFKREGSAWRRPPVVHPVSQHLHAAGRRGGHDSSEAVAGAQDGVAGGDLVAVVALDGDQQAAGGEAEVGHAPAVEGSARFDQELDELRRGTRGRRRLAAQEV